jgi:uncharacterized protein YbjT (DUF2867 family)
MMSKTLLITGASGQLGHATTQALATRGFKVKAASRHPEKLKTASNVEAVLFDYDTPATCQAALAGVQGLFLVAPPMDTQAHTRLAPFLQAAQQSGIGHIVLASALGADQNEQVPLRVLEHLVMDSGIPWTILRPNFFMENFSTGFIAPMIRNDNGIFLAADASLTSFISTRDIADVAATAFDQEIFGKEYTLTGPEALDHTEAARLISDATGRAVTYHALPEEAMLQGARDNGMPESAVQYLAMLYSVVRAGYMAAITPDVETVTGHKPTSFAEFAKAEANCWKE